MLLQNSKVYMLEGLTKVALVFDVYLKGTVALHEMYQASFHLQSLNHFLKLI